MKKRVAWLITHDAYIDRRIFFFADVLLQQGWSVSLFPSPYTDLTGESDPSYVVRPMDWSLVKLYGLSLAECQEAERILLERIISAQESYHAKNGYYAASLGQLQDVERHQSGYELNSTGGRWGYIAGIQQGGRCLIYDGRTQHVTVIPNCKTAALAREYEEVLSIVNKDEIEREGYATYGDIAVGYIWKSQGKILAAHCKSNDNGVWAFHESPPALYRGTPKQYSEYSAEEFGGQIFDWTKFRNMIYDFSPIFRQVKSNLQEETPDLVYVADLPTLPIGIMLKRTTKAKLIVDCHEWWHKQEKLWNSEMKNRIAISEKTEAELYPECDLCITVGQFLAQDMSKCYQKDFHVIYSCMSAGLSLQERQIEKEMNFWRQYGVPDNSHVAIFQGSLTSLRNLENLARATKYLPEDCYLAIVGSGDYEEEFLRIAKEEGEFDRLVMVGWVNQSELLRYTVNADLGVLPYVVVDEYFAYSVPNKLMEYFEAKLPILFDASMKEISMIAGENHVGVGVDLKDPVLFGETMAKLLRDKNWLEELRGNYAQCQDMFCFKTQKQAFENMLDKIDMNK